jgi:hypothetical protein
MSGKVLSSDWSIADHFFISSEMGGKEARRVAEVLCVLKGFFFIESSKHEWVTIAKLGRHDGRAVWWEKQDGLGEGLHLLDRCVWGDLAK